MHYQHQGVDHKKYARTDEPLLSFRQLKNELPQLRVMIDGAVNVIVRKGKSQQSDNKQVELCLLDITKSIAMDGQYLIPEWFKLYQILTTLPVGSNECKRSFSSVRRIKAKLRNSLSTTALETAVKFTTLKPDVTENDVDLIVKNFYRHPGRAKARNITLYIKENTQHSDDDID